MNGKARSRKEKRCLERKIKYWRGEVRGERKGNERKVQRRTGDENSRGC